MYLTEFIDEKCVHHILENYYGSKCIDWLQPRAGF